MWFTRVSINNPVFAAMMMLAFVVLGMFAVQRLQVDQFPNIDLPIVVIVTDYPGATPEVVENEVTKKIEEGVNSIAGISQLSSRTYEGTSVVIVEFELSRKAEEAAQDVRDKIAIVKPILRKEVKEPRILRFDPSSRPVFTLAVARATGSAAEANASSLVELTTFADQTLRKRLENVRGVGSVSLAGGVKREIQIYVDPQALEANGISIDAVGTAIRNENIELPAGALKSAGSERIVQIKGRIARPQEFGRLIVGRRAGQPVYLEQVARVVDGQEEVESLALYNGERVLAVDVVKAQGENTIAVVDALKKTVLDMKPLLPPGIELRIIRDTSTPIRTSVNNVRQTMFEGAALTILIVFLFLGSWRSTVITGLTLPIALIGTFLFMYWFGFTMNIITLLALSLCVGLLIDDAIVVRENIVRHAQMGKTSRQAALDGTNEIGLAVLATTLSIVAVFIPVGFMGGIIGRFFHQFGITVVAAVMISMFVSFTLDPMLSSVWHDPEIHRDTKLKPKGLYAQTIGRVLSAFDRGTHWLGDTYQSALAWALRYKKTTLAIAFITIPASLFVASKLGTEFVPQADFGDTFATFYTPPGTSLEATELKARQAEAKLREMPEVAYTLASMGGTNGKNTVNIYMRLKDRKERTRNVKELGLPMRQALASIGGITVTSVGLSDPVGGEKTIALSIQGTDLKELQRLSQEVTKKLRGVSGLVDLDTSMKPDKPVVSVELKRDVASDQGVNVAWAANALRNLIEGDSASLWRAPNDETYNVRVRLRPENRSDIGDLGRLTMATGALNADGSMKMVALRQIADIKNDIGASQINRKDLNREVYISANVFGRSAGEVSAEIRTKLDSLNLPPGYRYKFGGSTKNMQESAGYAMAALALAIIFIYMILASQFNSLLQPIAIMSSLPLTLIGVVLALLLFRSTMNMFSIIGIVMLMGLVTKNAILLVDFANRARKGDTEGHADGKLMSREEALLLAAKIRLRPILMTTLAMIFGMIPLAFGLAEGAEQRAPMGQAVIGGVITSSVMTLVVVPVTYCYLDRLGEWVKLRVLKLPSPTPVIPASASQGAE